jgi:hypothetical protein
LVAPFVAHPFFMNGEAGKDLPLIIVVINDHEKTIVVNDHNYPPTRLVSDLAGLSFLGSIRWLRHPRYPSPP